MGSPAVGLAKSLAATWAIGLGALLAEGLAQGLEALGASLAAGLVGGSPMASNLPREHRTQNTIFPWQKHLLVPIHHTHSLPTHS